MRVHQWYQIHMVHAKNVQQQLAPPQAQLQMVVEVVVVLVEMVVAVLVEMVVAVIQDRHLLQQLLVVVDK